ncbi:hypothetical protein N7513_002232 [Penicillium frequentans]|nr:hypothetical protein N7513_002232 [Penicillium glabrum]
MRWTGGLAGFLAGTLVSQAVPCLSSDVNPAEVYSSVSSYLAANPITTRHATQTANAASMMASVLAGDFKPRLPTASRSRCPVSCSSSGLNSTAWSVYHSVDRLDLCNSTMLLDFSLFNELDDPSTHISIAACTADFDSSSSSSTTGNSQDTTCSPFSVSQSTVTSSLKLASSGSTSSTGASDVVDALVQLQTFFAASRPGCNDAIQIAYSGQAAVGVFVGSGLNSQGVISSVLDKFTTQIETDGTIAKETLIQACENSTARYSLGVFISTQGDLVSVQQAIQSWSHGSCIDSMEESTQNWETLSFSVPSSNQNSSSLSNSTDLAPNATLSGQKRSVSHPNHGYSHSYLHYGRVVNTQLQARDDSEECTTIQAVSGDDSTSLASECGITVAEFDDYNSAIDMSDLQAGQHVCCTNGTLPDYTPQPDSDDNCYSYTVQTDDTCSALAAAYDITVTEIETWNNGTNGTWGWMGCGDLLVGSHICLSSGWPPMPSTISNAVCGPQVNGTATATHGTDLSTINECPLNACCDIWGQCGITAEFCTKSNSTTGNPGTAAKDQNGCISNCGTDIVVSDAPAETYSIAYFEAFDQTRPCLTMSVDQINTTFYSHIHFAFATITSDYAINVTGLEDQISLFSNMTGVKRILSIGGWSFSTDADTYMIFRDAVTAANRDTLITNVVDFLEDWDLDGVDFDWEYPDEPDIEGIPAGTAADSTNYYITLDLLKASMPTGKTVSLTAPASFWYLERFPIEAIGTVVDYIVYMTYDLHGQWDYGNAYSDDGCSDGNCLRSHVNMTETLSALSMITKAGVSSNKVAVGVASYARSFEMTEAGCWTDMCTYTGPDSGALPGPCTDTAGYISNYELELVMAENPSAVQYWDNSSYSNILVYNETQWAAYMNDTNKAVRTTLYENLNFLGISDWAVDLQSEDGNEDSAGSGVIYISPSIFNETDPIVAGYPPFTMVWPTSTLDSQMTVNFPPYPYVYNEGGYDYTSWVSVPSRTVDQMSFFQWSGPPSGIPTTTYTLSSSFSPSPITIIGSDDNLPMVFYPPPIETPFTTPFAVVDGSSYMVMDGTITLGDTDGLSIVTGIPSPAATAQTVTEIIYVDDPVSTTSATVNNTIVVVVLPTDDAGSVTSNTLPQTTSTSGTIIYTWSEQQIDSLASIDTTTTITTTNVNDKTTTTEIVPVNTGGFYWSPVSVPDIPLPTVPFPDLAPIPTLPCFTLFDIFTIDCPPSDDENSKKSSKTVKYTSGKESPTCSPSTAKSCGIICTSNCDPSSTSTSETTTSSTTCSSESTVTDYWVSCDSTSCSTTSTATVTGCDVTAATTTTGLYCAATSFSDIWSTDDQGENGAQYTTSSTVTIPEEVVAAGTTYVVGANGAVTLGNGDVITVPTSVAGTTTVTLGTVVATVDPAQVTVVAVVVATDLASTSTTSKSTTSTSKSKSTTSTTTKKTTSTTKVAVPTATEFCAKYVIENEDTTLDKYGSEYDQFVFVMWGIQWSGADDDESEYTGLLEDCGVTADIHVAVDTTEWGTIAMWNNGETDVLTSCVKLRIKALGGGTPSCKWIYKTSEDDDYSAKDSAEAEMTWIYNNHKSVISAPYPLAT